MTSEFPAVPTGDIVGRFVALHADGFRYVAPSRRWLVWVGDHWRIDDTEAAEMVSSRWVRVRASCSEDYLNPGRFGDASIT